jgi:TolB protein
MRSLKGILLMLVFLLPLSLQAALEIRITQGVSDAIPIAIAPFVVEGGATPPQRVGDIVMADLQRSGRFSPLSRDKFAQPDTRPDNVDLFAWRNHAIDYLVVGKLIDNGGDSFNVQFQLFDTAAGRQLAGYNIPARSSDLRRAAHQVSDLVYEAIIGERGAFNTQVVYVTSKKGVRNAYALQVADSDGYNPRTILRSKSPIMSPDWSPDARNIAYVSFEDNRSSIYVQDVTTGRRHRVTSKPGINGAPDWSPDGTKLALTLSESGTPQIYVLNIATRKLTRVTNDRALNTEPVWMPDGETIVYTSNRTGKPQLYRISASGGRPQRLTFEGEYNSAPAVSPDGKKIAMINGDGGRFRVALLHLDTGETQILTKGRLDESPSFAPNGSMIIYATTEGGREVLAAVSDDGRVHQTIVLEEGQVREPDWSPFLN